MSDRRQLDISGEIVAPRKKIKISIELPPQPPEPEDQRCGVCGTTHRYWCGYQMKERHVCVECCARPSFRTDGPSYPDNTVFAAGRGVINAIQKEVKHARR